MRRDQAARKLRRYRLPRFAAESDETAANWPSDGAINAEPATPGRTAASLCRGAEFASNRPHEEAAARHARALDDLFRRSQLVRPLAQQDRDPGPRYPARHLLGGAGGGDRVRGRVVPVRPQRPLKETSFARGALAFAANRSDFCALQAWPTGTVIRANCPGVTREDAMDNFRDTAFYLMVW